MIQIKRNIYFLSTELSTKLLILNNKNNNALALFTLTER